MSRLPRPQIEQNLPNACPTRGAETVDRPDADTRAAEHQPAQEAAHVLDAVAALWTKIKPTMLGRVTTVEDATLALMEGMLNDEVRRNAEREAHKLAGAAGSYGFTAGSGLAREIELLLGRSTTLSYTDALRLADLVVELRRELEGQPVGWASEVRSIEPAGGPDDLCLLVAGVDSDLLANLEAEAAARGLHLRVMADASEIWTEVANFRPLAVLLDLAAMTDLDPIANLSERLPEIPVLVLTDGVSFTDRVQIARLGVRCLLPRPQTPRNLIDAVFQVLPAPRVAGATVLVVDDDPELLAFLDTMLTPAGLRLTLVDGPEQFWDALEDTPPDLVVLDLDMPDVSGLDLCRMLRNDLRHDSLPVLFLTVQTDAAIIQQIFAAGADDYVTKPVIGPELLTRISNRLERARMQRETVESDPLTGLANRHTAELAFDQFFRLAMRQDVPVALAIVDVDHFRQINEQHGHATADQVLRHLSHLLLQGFRGHDIAARWGDGEFVVGMFGAGRDVAVSRLTEILQTFRGEDFDDAGGNRFRATFSAGAAEYPIDGSTLQDLCRAADTALSQAKTAGRARVIPSGWIGEPQLVARTVDVALVEDDAALASLLLHALANHGYRTEWFQDGEAAARALTGPQVRVQARVVLLDVGLPSLDGFDVLRRLVDSGVTHRTRVIMLTAHTAENEVLAALELGAFDHVAKPFSTPVLLQRIRRAMHS